MEKKSSTDSFTKVPTGYISRIIKRDATLVVSAIPTPNLLEFKYGEWTGPIIKLLKAIAKRIPWIKRIKIIESDSLETTQVLLKYGIVLFDITPFALNSIDIIQFIASLVISKRTDLNTALIIPSSLPSVTKCITNELTKTTALKAFKDCVTAQGYSIALSNKSPLQNVLLRQLVLNVGFNLTFSDIPVPTNATTLNTFLLSSNSPYYASICDLEAGTLEELRRKGNGVFTQASSPIVWFIPQIATKVQLWLQFAFDQVVCSGEYAKIFEENNNNINLTCSPKFIAPPEQYSICSSYMPRYTSYEETLPDLVYYENDNTIKVVSNDDCD